MSERAARWRGGWWSGARRRTSPNQGPRPDDATVDLVVVHSISLPPGQFGGDAVERLFTNRLDWDADPYYATIRGLQVSAHFFVRRSGEVIQFVACDQRAWHAGASSWRGRERVNDFSIGVELEGIEGGVFAPAQYAALERVCRAIGRRYPIIGLAGHEHVAPGRKADPGAGFEWARLHAALNDLRWDIPKM